MNRAIIGIVWLVAVVAVVAAGCPKYYTQRPGGNCYRVWKARRHWWISAHKICRSQGGYLASMRNKAEADWVNDFYGKNRNGGDKCGDWYWIGVNDIAIEGHWVYSENNQHSEYSNWGRGEPNNAFKIIWRWGIKVRREDAAQVNYKSKEWNDDVIDNKSLCFVCEKRA